MAGKHYDLAVIGAGSGQDVAVGAAQHYGWKVALVEKGPLGGTCLNRGCIPSKMIIHAADVAEVIRGAGKFGLDATINTINFAAITNRANQHVDHEAAEVEKNLVNAELLDLYKGVAEFKDERTLQVDLNAGDTIRLTAERFLIAAGARPFTPPIEGLNKVDFWTSTEALRQTKQPQSLIIIGGGYIAAELGHFYGALGTEVTIIQRGESLINREDIDISQEFTRIFSQKHNVLLNTQTLRVWEDRSEDKRVAVADSDGNEEVIEAEALLVATGLQPNSDRLKIENAGVELDERGHVVTDEFLQTSQPHIWALGDIVGKAPFKHGANYEAQRVFWNLAGKKKYAVDYTVMPRAIFSSPQIAAVGLTQQEAEEQNLEFRISDLEFRRTGMGKALEEHDGFVKFILSDDGKKILGCHILGPEASTLIHEVVVVMSAAEGKVSAIKNSIHIHPALSEVVQRAL